MMSSSFNQSSACDESHSDVMHVHVHLCMWKKQGKNHQSENIEKERKQWEIERSWKRFFLLGQLTQRVRERESRHTLRTLDDKTPSAHSYRPPWDSADLQRSGSARPPWVPAQVHHTIEHSCHHSPTSTSGGHKDIQSVKYSCLREKIQKVRMHLHSWLTARVYCVLSYIKHQTTCNITCPVHQSREFFFATHSSSSRWQKSSPRAARRTTGGSSCTAPKKMSNTLATQMMGTHKNNHVEVK